MKMTKGGFDILRKAFGSFTQTQVNAINFLVDEFDKDKSISYPQAAYMLATTWHETARTMLPIKERGSDLYLRSKPYYPFIGYGYVQLTWQNNYAKAGNLLGLDLVNDPEIALKPEVAVNIMILGMKQGWFTGKRLSDYIDQSKKDYVNARRIINGTDKAQLVASYAETFEKALRSY